MQFLHIAITVEVSFFVDIFTAFAFSIYEKSTKKGRIDESNIPLKVSFFGIVKTVDSAALFGRLA